MINSFENQSNEVMEINNIFYTIMPSDISLFSDNAIQEDVHFRSKGAFAFRSKKSKSKIILTFPIPLLDPGTQEKYSPEEQELFENGLKLLSQLNAYPFCFVRSTRIYSYLGVSFNTPRDYLMFGVEELKVVQDLRVPGVLFAEVTLLFHNHMNLVKDFSFLRNISYIKNEKSYGTSVSSHAHESEVYNSFMDSISGDSLVSYKQLMTEIGMNESNSSFDPAQLLSNVILKVPYIAGVDELIINDAEDNIVLDIRDEDLDKIDFQDFKMYDRFTAGQNTFDGGTLQSFQGSEEQDEMFLKEPDAFLYEWRAYYLRDRFMFEPEINSIQSLTLSKKNIFASHHLGSSQHPYLQYMGKVPARMSISSVYNSKGSYEYNQKSTLNLFRLMMNSIDSNNTSYPGANSVNYIKIKSVVNNVLGIHNFIPGECALSASSELSNVESFQTTFIENSMDALAEESKIKFGKDIVNSEMMQRVSKVLSDYTFGLQRELKSKEELDYAFAITLLRDVSNLKIRLDVEKIGGKSSEFNIPVNAQGVDLEREEVVNLKTGEKFVSRKDGGTGNQNMSKDVIKNSAEYYKLILDEAKRTPPSTDEAKKEIVKKLMPMLTDIIADLDIRESLNTFNKGESKDFKGSDIYYGTPIKKGETKRDIRNDVKNLKDLYTFDVVANNLISSIYQTLVSRTEIGRLSLAEITGDTGPQEEIGHVNDTWLNSFVGDAQRDLKFEKYSADVNVRKYLDPFFFLQTTPHVSKLDFMEASQLLNGAAFDNLKNFINKEITDKGILDGGSSNAHELFADLAELQEKRYAPIDEAAERRQKESGSGGGALGISNIGKLGDYKNKPLGFVSSTYEGRVESANPDNQGWAYGKYQFNSATGGLAKFFALAPEYAKQFAGLTPASKAFNNKWVSIATNDRENFEKAQDRAAKKGWFDDVLAEADNPGYFKKDNRGVQEAIFSAAIQHGSVVSGILNPVSKIPGFKDMAADIQVKEIYKQRKKYYWSLKRADVVALRPAMEKRYASEVVMAMEIAQGGISNVGSSGLSETVGKASDNYINYAAPKKETKTKNDVSPKVKTTTATSSNQTSQSEGGGGKFKGKPKLNQKLMVKIHKIIDTDTIVVSNSMVNDGKIFTVRVLGIDAPESRKNSKNLNQWWAAESIAALKTHIQEGSYMSIVTKDKDAYGRVLANIYKTDGTDIAKELIAGGHTLRSPTNTGAINVQNKAKANGVGMWSEPDKVVTPDAFRKAHNISKEETNPVIAQQKSPDVSLEQPRKETLKQEFDERATNNLVPLDPKYSDYQVTSGFGWRTLGGKTQFHRGLDITRKAGPGTIRNVAVMAPTSGMASKLVDTKGGGRFVLLITDAQGFSCKFLHLENWGSIFNGHGSQAIRVKKGDILGYVGNSGMNTPGKNYHLHYMVEYDGVVLNPWFTAPLDSLPKNQAFNAAAYIHPKAFHSHTKHAKSGLNTDPKTKALVLKLMGGQALALNSAASSSYADQYTPEQIRGYSIISPDILPSVSVYDDTLKLSKHMDKMFSNMEHGLNISFPVIKGYVTVGNEDDEFYFKGTTLKTANYFELPTIQEFHLSTNNDYNPLDICTFSLINPSAISSIPDDFGLDGSTRKAENVDTQYFTVFYRQALKLQPGMKVHIKAGYSNNPNKLHTVFNGTIKEISGKFDAKMNLICESYASELVNNTIGFERPVDMSKRKNASTGLLIGYSLLEANINHFGAQLGRTRAWSSWIGSVLLPSWTSETEYEESKFFDGKEDSLLGGKGRAGDFRDPENKALVSPFNMGEFLWNAWNPSRANLSQRLYTNIYSDAIESVHDQYKSTFWARYRNLLSWDSEVFYSYWAFRSNSWSIIKEMEYRHPGTLAKPLWYEERQTVFYGTKEQLFVARDLDPKFMFNAGEAVRYTDMTKPFVASYMQERPKRLEPATGFHLLSSKLNILDNNMGFSRNFSTRINVIYYDDEYEGNMIENDSDVEIIVIDKGLKSFEIRDKTIALNGCHGQYLSWVYGIQELKKQAEMMYTGTITVTGKPDMRAGDYAYIEDSDRSLSGVIKIRECEHHYSHSTGYITTITPGLFVECTQFLWDTFFIQMGMASKITLIKSDLSVNETLTSNQLAQDYLEYLKVIQDIKQTTFEDNFYGVGGSVIVAAVIPFLVRNMLKNSTIFGAEPLAKTFKFAGEILKEIGVYGNDVARARIAATSAKKAEIFTKMRVRYQKVVARMDGTVISRIKSPTRTDRAIKAAARAAVAVWKATKKLPVSAVKLLTSRTGVTVIGSIWGVAKGVKTMFMMNPIGFILGLVLEMCVGFVMSKFKKLELTHNPLLLFPVNYKGNPYVTGITGFSNSGVLETLLANLKTNIKELRKASTALDTSSEGVSSLAGAGVVGLNAIAATETGVAAVAEGLSSFFGN